MKITNGNVRTNDRRLVHVNESYLFDNYWWGIGYEGGYEIGDPIPIVVASANTERDNKIYVQSDNWDEDEWDYRLSTLKEKGIPA